MDRFVVKQINIQISKEKNKYMYRYVGTEKIKVQNIKYLSFKTSRFLNRYSNKQINNYMNIDVQMII